jgi:hypothetical protein
MDCRWLLYHKSAPSCCQAASSHVHTTEYVLRGDWLFNLNSCSYPWVAIYSNRRDGQRPFATLITLLKGTCVPSFTCPCSPTPHKNLPTESRAQSVKWTLTKSCFVSFIPQECALATCLAVSRNISSRAPLSSCYYLHVPEYIRVVFLHSVSKDNLFFNFLSVFSAIVCTASSKNKLFFNFSFELFSTYMANMGIRGFSPKVPPLYRGSWVERAVKDPHPPQLRSGGTHPLTQRS